MLLLAADTSGNHGSIALAQCGADGTCDIIEVQSLQGGTFSAQLIPQIADLLARHDFPREAVDAFAAVAGPGSFTGLRVGLAGIKALAEVTGKPIAAVSLLEAVALSSQKQGTITSALDAGRREIYLAEYLNGKNVSPEMVVSQENFTPAGTVVTPDDTVAEFARSKQCGVEVVSRPRSDLIARLGWKHILAGRTVSAEALDANYVRRTDAEILMKP